MRRPVSTHARAVLIAALIIAAVAYALRLATLIRGGGLLGDTGYDDGVYYSAADALVHGRLPYRDFLLLHPPGVLLALSPFAWLGSMTADPIGMGAARIAFIGIGALNAVLVLLVGRRFGLMAGIVAGAVYAVFAPAVFAERSTVLEPLGTAAVLAGALLVARSWRRPGLGAAIAGAVAGLAVDVKIWYVVPVAVLLLFQRRGRAAMVLGTAVGIAAVYLPFFMAAPGAMWREVVLDQVGRPRENGSLLSRVADIVGASRLHLPGPHALMTPHKIGALLVLGLVIVTLATLTVRGARMWPVQLVAAGAVLLASPSYFTHYSALTAPAAAITVGIGVARLAGRLRRRRLRIAVALLVLVAVAAFSADDLRTVRSRPLPADALRPAAALVMGCVVSDVPGSLAAMNVLSRDLAAGCPLRPDLTGWIYDADSEDADGVHVPRTMNDRWQSDATGYLTSGAAVLLHRRDTGLDRESKQKVTAGPVLAADGGWVLHAVER